MFLQYYQMKQMNSRNPQAAAANPQMQTMQKFFPIIFGVIYLKVPAGATIYMVVSSAMRIGTQEVMFRTGMVAPVVHEREIGSGQGGQGETGEATAAEAGEEEDVEATDGTAAAKATLPPAKGRRAKTNGRAPATEGSRPRGSDDERQGGERRASGTGPEAAPAVALEAEQKGSIARGVGGSGGKDGRGGHRACPRPARGRRGRRRGDRGRASPRRGSSGGCGSRPGCGPGCARSAPGPRRERPPTGQQVGPGGSQAGRRAGRAVGAARSGGGR